MTDHAKTHHGQASSGDVERVLVVDLGAQYSRLIARRVREAGVFSEIVPRSISAAEVAALAPIGIILSGGPDSVNADDAVEIDPAILGLGVPVLGICYGHQLLAKHLGGEVAPTGTGEYGGTTLRVDTSSGLLPETGETTVWMSHVDSVTRLPDGFRTVASTPGASVAAMEDPDRGFYGVQFHPEVAHTTGGTGMIRRFVRDICGATSTWNRSSIVEQSIAAIRQQVGDAEVICALSGGVDSSVAAALVHRAIGDQLTCIFVDHGMLRQGEADQVVTTFRDTFHIPLVHIDATDRFLDGLVGVTDPETKRKIIGETFIRLFEEEALRHADAAFLVQGTLYPDVIESGGEDSATIKSHHNVGGLPDDMTLQLVEPLRDLFKDEVRAVGEELGLPADIVWRQPFPGPGLAVRIIGEVTPERLDILRQADAVVREEICNAGLEREIWQAFAVLPDIKSVGVQGDFRTYAYPIIVRAVTSEDAMTADWARLPYEVLERISSRVINEVEGINRVAYDISSKPPATIEWE